MPELPSVTIYCERLAAILTGHRLTAIDLEGPFFLRSVQPPVSDLVGREIQGSFNIAKRVVLQLEQERFIVMHLMIAGRLRWRTGGRRTPARITLAAFSFPHGTLFVTEAGTTRRAALHLVRGREALEQFDRGGIDVLSATDADFAAALTRENHTLKRCLTDQRLFSGIGNAYCDEILHHARLSPVKLSQKMTSDEIERLRASSQLVLTTWIQRHREAAGDGFPEKVTAFEEQMTAHGKYGQPCPTCGTSIQRIRYAKNETNYCPRCQTGGKVLADRSLSRLLKKDWPRRVEELEDGR